MKLFQRIYDDNYEQLVFCHDRNVGLKAIIAIHDTTLGPGTGGCRMYPYASEEAALEDVLRLSKGMTYKAAISGLKLGGAKAVILGDPKRDKTPALLRRYGQFVESLGGKYITAKDVGIGGEDLKIVQTQTQHILGIEGVERSSGDPSPLTAFGVFNGMKACAAHVYGSASLKGKKVALQGLGHVGYSLLGYLVKEGAQVTCSDVDSDNLIRAQQEFSNIHVVRPDQIMEQDCDIFSPNALGAVLNSKSIPLLKCKIVAGAANNQLSTDEDGFALEARGITYAPDYAINAGGLINIYHELGGYKSAHAYDHVGGIYRTIEEILARSKKDRLPPHRVADQMAQERLGRVDSDVSKSRSLLYGV